MAGTAERRAERARIKRNRRCWWGRKLESGAELGRVIDTPTPCSCWMCGNPRRWVGERTFQERRRLQEINDESLQS
jgi:hypothetical protein